MCMREKEREEVERGEGIGGEEKKEIWVVLATYH